MIKGIFNLFVLSTTLVWNTAIAKDSELSISVEGATVQYPYDCISASKFPCSVHSKAQKKYKFPLNENAVVHMAPNSVTFMESNGHLALVSGMFVIEALKPSKIETEFANLNVFPGKYLVNISPGVGINAVNINGFLTFSSVKIEHAIKLESGFEMNVSQISKKGWFEFGFPRPTIYRSTLKSISKTMDIERDEFFDLARKFQPVAREAVEKMSEFNKTYVARRIASHKAYLNKMKERRLRIRKANDALKVLFRKENYLE